MADHAQGSVVLKVHYIQETTYRPKGLKLDPIIESVDYHRDGELPFLPVAGMEIDVGDGDFRTVERVFFTVPEGQLTVHFTDCDSHLTTHRTWLQRGWVHE